MVRWSPKAFLVIHGVGLVVNAVRGVDNSHGYQGDAQVADLHEQPMQRRYKLRVDGHLDDHWSARFGDLTLTRESDGTTSLSGFVSDQSKPAPVAGATGPSGRHLRTHPAGSAVAGRSADDVLSDREVDAPASAQHEGGVEFAGAENGVPDA